MSPKGGLGKVVFSANFVTVSLYVSRVVLPRIAVATVAPTNITRIDHLHVEMYTG